MDKLQNLVVTRRTIHVAVHNSKFHLDEMMALAIISQVVECTYARSRSEEVWATADVLVDVGGTYNPEAGIYDHHFRGGPKHLDNTPMAATGLVWESLQYKISEKFLGDRTDLYEKFMEKVRQEIILPVDSADNGVNKGETTMSLGMVVSTFNTFDRDKVDEQFAFCLRFVSQYFGQYCEKLAETLILQDEVLQLVKAQEGPVFIMPRLMPWLATYQESPDSFDKFKVAIFPDVSGNGYRIQTFPVNGGNQFSMRCPAPKEFWGFRRNLDTPVYGNEVDMFHFVHQGGFIGGVTTDDEAEAVRAALWWVNNSPLKGWDEVYPA